MVVLAGNHLITTEITTVTVELFIFFRAGSRLWLFEGFIKPGILFEVRHHVCRIRESMVIGLKREKRDKSKLKSFWTCENKVVK